MKRCPECDFLYEDEQQLCDMDGTVLRFTSFLLPPAVVEPNPSEDRRSIWSGVTIVLLALVVIGSVLVTLYRATPPKLGSSSGSPNQPARTKQESRLPVSDSPQSLTTPAIPDRGTDPFALPETRTQNAVTNSSRPRPSTSEKRLTIEPATRDPFAAPPLVVNAPKAAAGQTSPAPPATQKAVANSKANAVNSQPPPIKPAPQSKTQNQEKDSKVKSLFKKAGRVFKKPF